jgi:hypothetical protein
VIANSNTQYFLVSATHRNISRVALRGCNDAARVSPVLRKVLSLGRLAQNNYNSCAGTQTPDKTPEIAVAAEPCPKHGILAKGSPTPPPNIQNPNVCSSGDVMDSSNILRWWKALVVTSTSLLYLDPYHD